MSRKTYIILTIAIFLIEVLIALFVHDSFIRPHLGDVLVVILIYCLVRCFIPKGVPLLPLYVFCFAASVECMQYFHIVELLGLQNCKIARIIIGSTFDWGDIAAYAVGCIIAFAASLLTKKCFKTQK